MKYNISSQSCLISDNEIRYLSSLISHNISYMDLYDRFTILRMVPTNIWYTRNNPSFSQQTWTKFSYSKAGIKPHIVRYPTSLKLILSIPSLKSNGVSSLTPQLVSRLALGVGRGYIHHCWMYNSKISW